MSDEVKKTLEEFFEEMARDDRTPEQKAHDEGYTTGFLAAEAAQRRKDGLLERYSQDDVLELWQKFKDGGHFSAEEAVRIGRQVHLVIEKHVTNGGLLLHMYDELEREYARGKRCSVCCRYGSEECATEC